ncbi:Galactose oxidase/kelch, beta-propeller [Lasallia pustulata]|uniref:Galactose oxidase/kelch, beta-propeller n=1 Tax=Lasallia pustulata TaxID=136370 RepID=A0A1W5CSY3_9LECA|nr:Galactose oxidase/kelch, beta-propeller [Lasallia pustulata]
MVVTFVIGNTLYIDGGEENLVLNGVQTGQQILNYTLAIDLSSSFYTFPNDNSINVKVIEKGDCPNFNNIRFWVDSRNNIVYAYGGEISFLTPGSSLEYALVPLESLWAFTPNATGGTWKSIDQYDSVWDKLTRPVNGLTASGALGGFNLGGYSDSHTSQKTDIPGNVPVPGLQFFNFTSQKWSNNSASDYYGTGTALFGGMVYVPTWGSAGLVVILGGQTINPQVGLPGGARLVPLSNISIYDPDAQTWYYQLATGDVPEERGSFCVAGVRGGDNSTFEIFLYSGRQGSNQQVHARSDDDIYILSLPAFVWFQVEYTPTDPRFFHTCHVVGNRQLLSVGGLNPSLPNVSLMWHDTDPYAGGLKVFDMTTLNWTNYYNASAAPYVPSDPVMTYYESKSRYPPEWNNPELGKLFIAPTSNNTNTANTSPTSTTSTTTVGNSHYARHSNIGPIAGGIVGGIGLVLAIFGVRRFCRPKPKEDGGPEAEITPVVSRIYLQGEVQELEDSNPLPPYEVGPGLPHELDEVGILEMGSGFDAGGIHELDAGPRSSKE